MHFYPSKIAFGALPSCARRHCASASAIAFSLILWNGASGAQEALPTIEVGATAPEGRAATPEPSTTAAASTQAPVTSSSEFVFTGKEINAIPFARPGEALEIVPGLVVTQHSGDGKANQYLLRGFQLDHGTDLALSLDGMPINMRTHGHGQGYADVNFLIPELLASVDARKGPYFADEGDFSSAGAVRMQYVDRLDKGLLQATGGSFAYGRLLGAKSFETGGGNLLSAVEAGTYDGPWSRPDEMRKINGLLRWSRGTQENGLSLTGMAYANRWYSTDQIPARAVDAGIVPLWGNIDPSDGGGATRFSLSGRWSRSEADSFSRVEAYAIRSSLELYNNFTYFLAKPDLGDQFRQFDRRTVLGVNAHHGVRYSLGDFPVETRIGLQSRYDNIRLGLQDSWRRRAYDTLANDAVVEGSVGLWTDTTVRWTPWLRTTAGVRLDYVSASVGSLQEPFSAPKDSATGLPIWVGPWNSGAKRGTIGSPKGGLVLGPFANTELFFNFGEGFHSTDARGTVSRFSSTDGSQIATTPLLVKSRGAEIGARTRVIDGLESTISFWWLTFDSENQFDGEAGTTIFGRPSRRYGVELTNRYSPFSWLRLDGDVALTHARFRGVDQLQALAWVDLLSPESIGYGTYLGNAAGNFIPEAPSIVASGGVEIGEKSGFFGALRYRYMGERPLTEDGVFKGAATGLLNARLGYRFEDGWRIQVDAFNIANSRSDQTTYAYGSLLRTDPLFGLCQAGAAPANVCAVGVMDRHFKPVEPPAVRVTVGGVF